MERFSLCWDNFHKNMSSGMHSMLENEDLVDVTLAVEGRCLRAHKMVLSVCSPYFRELFTSNPCKHPIVFMKDVSFDAMRDLLQFMYQGEVQVNQENLATFIKTAEALQIKGLTGDNNNIEEALEAVGDGEKTIEEEPATLKRPANEENVAQVKRPPPCPLSKKPKLHNENSVKTASTRKVQELNNFKIESCELSGNGQIGNNRIIEENADDVSTCYESEDYSLMESAEEEPQAGTSEQSGSGEGHQEFLKVSQPKRGRSSILVDGFIYHQNNKKLNVRYLVCSEYKRLVCKARALLPLNGTEKDLVLTKPHNHPPNLYSKERESFMKYLRQYISVTPNNSLRDIYNATENLYPEGASLCPYNKVVSTMRRWRANTLREGSNMPDNEMNVAKEAGL